jgi:hypothetical protein
MMPKLFRSMICDAHFSEGSAEEFLLAARASSLLTASLNSDSFFPLELATFAQPGL